MEIAKISPAKLGLTKLGAGFYITLSVLFILLIYIGFLSVNMAFRSTDASAELKEFQAQLASKDSVNTSTVEYQIKILELLQKERKESREFTMQLSQLVLANVLLPIITALLGYMFASEKRSE